MRRFGLRDDQWERIKNLLPGREGSVGVTAADNRLFVEAVLYRYRTGMPWRDLRAVRRGDKDPHSVRPLGQKRCLGADVSASRSRRRQRIRDDRQHRRARPSA
jgi:transposase